MKKLSYKYPTINLVVIMVTIIHALASCRCVEVVSGSEVQNVQMFKSVDTILVHDSIYLHDSVIYRERTIHDTVYITKEVYRDANHSTLNAQHSTKTDTIRETEYVTEIIEKPPERYVPKFYKWCTIALWAIGLLAIGYGLLRRMRR